MYEIEMCQFKSVDSEDTSTFKNEDIITVANKDTTANTSIKYITKKIKTKLIDSNVVPLLKNIHLSLQQYLHINKDMYLVDFIRKINSQKRNANIYLQIVVKELIKNELKGKIDTRYILLSDFIKIFSLQKKN
jgi:hypothetical protein